jgi:hypothetical protein
VFGWLVADSWCWFVLREEYCWLVGGGWFVLREKYCWRGSREGGGSKERIPSCSLSYFSSLLGVWLTCGIDSKLEEANQRGY